MSPLKTAPAGILLTNAANELRALRAVIERLEAAAFNLLQNSDGDHSHELMEIQQLDHLMQSIMNIADFLGKVGENIPEDVAIEFRHAVEGVKLQALARRLCTPDPAKAFEIAENESGDCCLF